MLFRGQTLGKYKIIAPLGSGGFGTVYLAQDTWIDKKVAIKVPHRQGLDFGELLREPRLLASVSHPNIVAITTAEKQDSVFFIVMEYVQGETLENIIGLKGSLELNRALDFTCQICNAVDHAHRQGVIHRDLRPANVMVTENDMVKVADFGTSRFLEIAAHGTTVIGSPPYMAPEQFHGKAVFASDIYSLGVTMYQMLTGLLPYDTPAPADLEKLMSGELVTPPRLKNSAIPKAVNDVVMRAMSPDLTVALSARDRSAGGCPGRRYARQDSPNAASRSHQSRGTRASRRRAGDPDTSPRARNTRPAILLAVPQAAARAHGQMPVLRRASIADHRYPWAHGARITADLGHGTRITADFFHGTRITADLSSARDADTRGSGFRSAIAPDWIVAATRRISSPPSLIYEPWTRPVSFCVPSPRVIA